MNKKENLKNLILRLHTGENQDQVKEEFKRDFGHISSSQIAKLEAELIRDGMAVEEIQRLCNVHAEIFTGDQSELHFLDQVDQELGHPLHVFRKENYGLVMFLKETFQPLFAAYKKDFDPTIKVDLLAEVKELEKITKHYTRKEMLFFPYLEKAGVQGISQVMWGKDDEIRALLKETNSSLDGKDLVEKIDQVLEEVNSMIVKENDILSPLLLKNIKRKDWIEIAKSSGEIGYAFTGGLEGASPSDSINWLEKAQTGLGVDQAEENLDQAKILEGQTIYFPSGAVDYKDLVAMLNTYPQDITFIDKEDKVVYFSEGKNPVFPRTRTIIGRDVRNCHPPKAILVVNQLLEDFKAGKKDVENRFMKKGNKIFLIRYFAVRDDQEVYVGTLETTEEISEILDLVAGA
ncbi:MAG: DUF438 domain-containing protein [Bacillota bacterium]|nr:DUF438 domain-containing protein [Bacillota bacterium]